ncbi:MAG: MgtC/SapB family protein [Planctomycetota bacterium]|nr:MAG: MgtC/SapB family protein [Planctomycetota bacterium]REJ88574.1 MAG: MgtC/SapB family protein [Planctomycetota bacterium]REK17546.1 MAG: MgtC/SapB family protein [Planctomycetota bacterium]REK47455.1 MAG: MgtC/SapB family protein [Planctomycetota bacterium]
MDVGQLVDFLIRVAVAVAVGGVVGIERELHGRWAGLRTHMLVSMGAAIFTIAGLGVAGDSSAEVSRVVQGIAAGIGFLGAGTILKLSDHVEVKGLTTAASIWLAAALGTSAGLKMYELAVVGAVVAIVVLAVLRPLDKWFSRDDDDRSD